MSTPRRLAFTKASADRATGGLSRPSKMPGAGYGLPARRCPIGSQLARQAGTVCSGCYALKGRYVFPNVQAAQERRHAAVLRALASPEARAEWLDAMAYLIDRDACEYFRFHDSGDLQSVAHLALYVALAERMPHVRFWLPTREYQTVREYLAAGNRLPGNLTVRLSAHLVDVAGPRAFGLPTSTVHTVAPPAGAVRCVAPDQGGACGDCRACWTASVREVSYAKH